MRDKIEDIKYFMELKKAIGLDAEKRKKITNFMKQDWFNYFHKMRIRVVHRLPVSLGALLYGKTIEFPFLPDEPLKPKSTSQKKLDPLTECEKWLKGVFNFIDNICGDLEKELFNTF